MSEEPSTLNYDGFFNSVSKNLAQSAIREFAKIFGALPDEKINVSLSLPNIETYPLKKIDICLKDGTSFAIEGNLLEEALQYQSDTGYTKLLNWLKRLQNKIHGARSWDTTNLIMSSGSQEGIAKAVEMILDPGDAIIVQDPSYPGFLSLLRPINAEIISLKQDFLGMKIKTLKLDLKRRLKSGKRMPKLMYVIPVGGNPTGLSISDKQKNELYQLACRYNFLILEDDPYYYLNYSDENRNSFFSLDTEKRVIRFDSFSKILSAGLRVGFVSGPTELLDKMNFRIQTSSMHPAALSQVIIHQILQRWNFEGFVQHLNEVQIFYKNRRDIMLRAAEKYLKGLADWIIPDAGFFLWIRLNYVKDTRYFALKKCWDHLIFVTPGNVFFVDDQKSCPYLRLSYSSITEDQIDYVFSKFAFLIREEISNVK